MKILELHYFWFLKIKFFEKPTNNHFIEIMFHNILTFEHESIGSDKD